MNEKLLLNNPNKELLQLVNVTFEPFDAFFGTTTITSDYFDPIIYYEGSDSDFTPKTVEVPIDTLIYFEVDNGDITIIKNAGENVVSSGIEIVSDPFGTSTAICKVISDDAVIWFTVIPGIG